jgi:hypothetical protein
MAHVAQNDSRKLFAFFQVLGVSKTPDSRVPSLHRIISRWRTLGKFSTAFSSCAIAAGDTNALDSIATTANRIGTHVQLKFLNTLISVLL